MFLGKNVGQQCVAMSLCSLLLLQYHIRDQLTANDLAQIINIGNLFYSSFSQLTRQAFLMQSELPTALHVFDTNYQLEYSESYSGTVHQETTIEGDQYCTSLWRAFESHISKNYTNYIITLRCIAVTTYCNSKMGFKYLILVLEICVVESSLKVQVFFLKNCPLIVLCIIFHSILNGIFEVRGVQVENIQNRMVSQHSVNEPQTSI